jgi:hypothetical protein
VPVNVNTSFLPNTIGLKVKVCDVVVVVDTDWDLVPGTPYIFDDTVLTGVVWDDVADCDDVVNVADWDNTASDVVDFFL